METFLHAFLPFKFVDHTHSDAIMNITNRPNGKDLCKKIFGPKVSIVPYVMPGFGLAQKINEVYSKNPNINCLILLNHGIFTFANNAKESYERMIKYITKAEKELTKKSKRIRVSKYFEKKISISEVSNLIRQQIANKRGDDFERKVVHFNKPKFFDELFSHPNLKKFTNEGPVTPDHVIRIK